tara:strand:+ start:307 stop:441 length:135 start_codon:yes stop_codon:yes gene_type:complete
MAVIDLVIIGFACISLAVFTVSKKTEPDNKNQKTEKHYKEGEEK